MKTYEISQYDDIISVDDLRDAVEDLTDRADDDDLNDDECEELQELSTLLQEADDYSVDGVLIRDSYFVDYVQELVEDIGDLPRNLPSYIYIDWERTAEAIKIDYTAFEFRGKTFWGR